jgi:hypothetical protein
MRVIIQYSLGASGPCMNPAKASDKYKMITRKSLQKGGSSKPLVDRNPPLKEDRNEILHMNFNLDIPDKLSERGEQDSVLGQTDREVEVELGKHLDEAKDQYKKKQAEFK